MFSNISPGPAVCGHRGAPSLEHENTIASFEAARKHGATWLEFDIRPTADDRFVVHHDPVTAEGHHIGSASSNELPSYIPLLTDVVASFGDLVLDVELKTDDTNRSADSYVALAASEITSLAASHPQASFLVTSFDADVLRSFAGVCPEIATGYLYYVEDDEFSDDERDRANRHALEHAINIGHQAVVPHHRLVTNEMVAAAHESGLRVATWTVNTTAEARRCAQAAVDVIIGDDPRVIIEGVG